MGKKKKHSKTQKEQKIIRKSRWTISSNAVERLRNSED